MACTTIFRGEGGNCNTGLGLGNFLTYTLSGVWTLGTATACGRTWTALYQNGVKHPNPNYLFYPPTATISYSDCGILAAQPYDCVNGGCVPKTTYNTPGVYASLAACESGCAKNSNCTGECVSAAEIAALQQAANDLVSRLCK